MPLVISVDVEDWPQSTWDRSLPITERAEVNTQKLLDLLARQGRTVTMFILGRLAERFPQVVQRIAAEGHEVASHGYGHLEVFKQSPDEFREDVHRSKRFLEDLLGKPILGYRAPDFSITRQSLWALEVLSAEGFTYDSSIYPVAHPRYGIPDWPAGPVNVTLPSGRRLVELPIAAISFLGRSWPVAGGGYHRLLPWPIIAWAVRRCHADHRPFVSYCHPYEFDPDEMNSLSLALPLKTRLHQGLGRRGFAAKFQKLLQQFEVVKAGSLAGSRAWPAYAVPVQGG